ncbi:MAG TPA: sugar isomerase [Bacteroidales bacterium]|nr:sugar isomerase [Bacteroidales bacterium]
MNLKESRYNKFALVREMMETTDVIKKFDQYEVYKFGEKVKPVKGLFLTGEGSSRIFPAKRMIYDLLRRGMDLRAFTDGSTQALEYDLGNFVVFGASNSGQTKEVIRLFEKLKGQGHNLRFGLTANLNTRLEDLANDSHVLKCGKEDAVAATKSVIEQALFYDAIVHYLDDEEMKGLDELAEKVNTAMTLEIDNKISYIISQAPVIYFAGRNTGVAEELTLKTNEITRKKSEFLEGTYGVHGIEEVMNSDEVAIWINPFPDEIEKFDECLIKGVGMNIVAVSDHETKFPTVVIPNGGKYSDYVELAAGWNILVETGIKLGIDLDKPKRARKVGNIYTGS